MWSTIVGAEKVCNKWQQSGSLLFHSVFSQFSTMWLYSFMIRKIKFKKKNFKNWYIECLPFHLFQLGIWNTSTDCSLKYLLLFENIVRLFLLRESSPFNAWKGLKCPCLQTLETISLFSNQSFYGIKKYYSFSSVFHPYTYTKVCWKSFSQQV